ncbi:MAG TPA: response regulator, partial [Gemmata sp.]|jgi:CheY-like chemotaxis protein|nr:response regulator [Gemmata sp.]
MDVSRKHILVVDDLADAADSTAELLSIWVYDAIACYSGATALESACRYRPDVVLLDLGMPCMDGFQFARLFHELSGCRSIPIIAVSGHFSQACRSNAREAGILQYLLKPADPKCLKELLARTIAAAAILSSLSNDITSHPTVNSPRPKRRILHDMSTPQYTTCSTSH